MLFRLSIFSLLLCALTITAEANDPWTPAETNTWGWWDPSDAANMNTNASGGVTTLFDLSGNGNNLNASSGKEPSAFTRLIGTQYGLDHDRSVNQHLVKNGWSGLATNGQFAVFAVFDYDSDSQSIVNFQDDMNWSRSSINPYGKRSGGNGGMNYTGGPYDDAAIFNANVHWDPSETLPLSFFNAYVNGTMVTTNKAMLNQFPSSDGLRFTFLTGNNNQISMDGCIGEVIVVEDVNDDSRHIFEGYLAWKWGLQNLLPEDHPYERRPPGVGPPGTVILLF